MCQGQEMESTVSKSDFVLFLDSRLPDWVAIQILMAFFINVL